VAGQNLTGIATKENSFFRSYTPWGIVLFIILALIIFLPAIGEYRAGKKELINLWHEQSQLISEIILRSGHNIMAVEQEMFASQNNRLLENGRLIRDIDSIYYPQRQPVMQTARMQAQGFALFFDKTGNPESNMPPRWSEMLKPIQDEISESLHEHPPSEPVSISTNFRTDRPAPPVLLIRRVMERGFIAIIHRPSPMREDRDRNRLGDWLEQISRTHFVLYIEIFRDGKSVAYNGKILKQEVPAFESADPRAWRVLQTGALTVFEYNHYIPEGLAVRVGLSAAALDTLNTNLKRRLILNSVLLLVIGSALSAYILKKQNFALLSGKYLQMQTMTGSILEQMSDGIIVLNSQREVVISNNAASRLLQPAASLKPDSILDPEILPFPDPIRQAIRELRPISQAILSTPRHLIISSNLLRYRTESENSDGQLLYLIILHDYTSQKELEDFRSRRDRLMAMGHLAARVAHEIRNPLNGIGVIAQRLQREYGQPSQSDEYRQLTQAIRQETGRINKIIEDFLVYARTPELKPERLNLSELLEEMKPILASLGSAEINYEIDTDCFVRADRDQLRQVLLNLVKNAMEASQNDTKIEIQLQRLPDKILMHIADNGRGIDRDSKTKIFDLYYTTKENGSGIGLSIVEKIISAHGGNIRVESPYEKQGKTFSGTQFTIELEKFDLNG